MAYIPVGIDHGRQVPSSKLNSPVVTINETRILGTLHTRDYSNEGGDDDDKE